jgi:hypothetical protein
MVKDKPSYLRGRSFKTRAPDSTMLGERRPGAHITLTKGTKPPPLRFKIGSYLRYEGCLYEVMYAYRTVSNPHEWIYCLEVRKDLMGTTDAIGELASAMGLGEATPRVVYDLFRDDYEANRYFWDIPCNGDRTLRKNGTLVKDAQVVSSGQVLSSTGR